MNVRRKPCWSLLVLGFTCALVWSFSLLGCASTSYQPFKLISSDDIEYPEEAKKSKITGTVTVQYDIQTDGSVTNVSVVSADPPDIFDEEAVRYVSSWVFRPAMMNKVPQVTENVESKVTFKLADVMENPPDY